MADKIATWEIGKIPYHKEIQEISRKLGWFYFYTIVSVLVLFLIDFVLIKCGCKVASVIFEVVAFVVGFIWFIYWAAVVGKAKCCNCGGSVLIWSLNVGKVLGGCFPLCHNCRKILGVDFIKPKDGGGDTLPPEAAGEEGNENLRAGASTGLSESSGRQRITSHVLPGADHRPEKERIGGLALD